MRKDLILYILAGVFFIITAISLILATEQLYVVSTAVVGLALATAGIFLKPKTATISNFQSTSPASTATAPTTSTVTEAPAPSAAVPVAAVEAPVAIVPKLERSIVRHLHKRHENFGKSEVPIKDMMRTLNLAVEKRNEFLDALRRLEKRNIVRLM